MATLISCTIFRKIQGKLISLIKSPEAAAQLEEMKRLLDEALEQYEYVEPPYKYENPLQY